MKKAGDLLSAIIDEKMMNRAQGYSQLFYSWAQMTAKYGIAAAADHSRIRELTHNILLVEADHPGWIQILQTKEHKLLAELQARFPDLEIGGISFRLSRAPFSPGEAPVSETSGDALNGPPEDPPPPAPELGKTDRERKKAAYEKIKDRELRERLKSLERSISAKKRSEKE
ncbi:MAG: DUF721 domain-containing protein [Treponema sp.]|jgi:hypothetical protein|nr:DUF721 domain-containing protein [Treponema sp.]